MKNSSISGSTTASDCCGRTTSLAHLSAIFAFWQHALPYDYCKLDELQWSLPIAVTGADPLKILLHRKQDYKSVIMTILDSTTERMD